MFFFCDIHICSCVIPLRHGMAVKPSWALTGIPLEVWHSSPEEQLSTCIVWQVNHLYSEIWEILKTLTVFSPITTVLGSFKIPVVNSLCTGSLEVPNTNINYASIVLILAPG